MTLWFPLLLLLTVGTMRAQTTGSLAGRVLDSNRKRIAGATVVVLGTSPLRGAITRVDGSYRIAGIRAGTYAIKVSAVGFEQRQRDTVKISINHESRLEVRLRKAGSAAPPGNIVRIGVVRSSSLDSSSRISLQNAVMRAMQAHPRLRGDRVANGAPERRRHRSEWMASRPRIPRNRPE
ncbi:MAG: TonB-dependent receptor [Chlorobi bacterium]|nr:TonB-dependent receptor [Chlorobiota bacterium]